MSAIVSRATNVCVPDAATQERHALRDIGRLLSRKERTIPVEQRDALVVLGPLPLYAAKPYAHLPGDARTVEYVPDASTLRWLWAQPSALPNEWGLRRVSLPFPQGVGRLGPALRPLARRLLPPEVKRARAIVITSPFQDSLCGLFSAKPLLYHVFDEYASYGWTDELIGRREARILQWSRHIVVVSDVLARLYRDKYRVPTSKITVIPNGYEPTPPRPTPSDLAAMPRPRIGTLGNVNVRLRLDWVLEILEALPWATWTFVGGVMDDGFPQSRQALAKLRQHPRCAFVGAKPYDELAAYAAAFDLAVFPFSNHILNRASSPTRFFSQLPFGQPLLVSKECEQLVSLQPLVRVCESAAAFIQALSQLKSMRFRDGQETARVEHAKGCTWSARAQQLAATLETIAPRGHVAGTVERRPSRY